MAHAQSFALLRLPRLAAECVVSQMEARDQFLLAKLCKATEKIVAVANRRCSVSMDVTLRTSFLCIDVDECCRIEILKIDGRSRRTTDFAYFVEDPLACFKKHLEFLAEIFNRPSLGLSLENRYPADTLYGLIPFMKKLNLEICCGSVETVDCHDGLLEYLLTELRNTEELFLDCPVPNGYELDTTEPFNFKKLTLYSADWFTLEHMNRFMECAEIQIEPFNMEEASLNVFINEWLKGDSCLEFVKLKNYNRLSMASILEGIEKRSVSEGYIEGLLAHFNDGDAFLIENAKGVEALVWRNRDSFTLTTRHNEAMEYDEDDHFY